MFIVDRKRKAIVNVNKVESIEICKISEGEYGILFIFNIHDAIPLGNYSSEERANCILETLMDKLKDYIGNKVWELPIETKTKKQIWEEMLKNTRE